MDIFTSQLLVKVSDGLGLVSERSTLIGQMYVQCKILFPLPPLVPFVL